jgi:hypothetical protein
MISGSTVIELRRASSLIQKALQRGVGARESSVAMFCASWWAGTLSTNAKRLHGIEPE